jgi:hypothetical protein
MLLMKKALVITIVLALFSALPVCSAWVGGSDNYNITISNVNYGAYDGSSDNYNIDFSLVDQFVGQNDTLNLNTTYGFYGGINYTGYSVGGPFDISIDAPASVVALATATASVDLVNQNPDFGEDALLEYWITDLSDNTLSSGSKTLFVGALSTVTTSVSLTAPSSAGNYIYHARVTWSITYTASASDSFAVTAAPSEPTPGPGPGGDGTRRAILDITQYPSNFTIEQDSFAYHVVEVTNIGNGNASNTVLILEGIGQYAWSIISPERVDIAPDETARYSLKIGVPDDTVVGQYNFTITALSGSITDDVNSTLNVIAVLPRDLRITDVTTFPETPKVGMMGKVRVFVENTGSHPTDLTMNLSVPNTWELQDEQLSGTLDIGEEGVFEFTFLPYQSGTFEVVVTINYDNSTITKMIAVVVEDVTISIDPSLLYFIILLFITGVVLSVEFYLFLSKRKKKKHTGKRMQETDEKRPEPRARAQKPQTRKEPAAAPVTRPVTRKRPEVRYTPEEAKQERIWNKLFKKLRRGNQSHRFSVWAVYSLFRV